MSPATSAPRSCRAQAAGHEVRGFARSHERVTAAGRGALDDVVLGDAISGAGLARALDGVDAAYYLIHSMEGQANSGFRPERRAADRFATAPAPRRPPRRLPRRLVPQHGVASRHLASRLAVERALLEAAAEPIALRASIVIGPARGRSASSRLIERLPVLALPAWRVNCTQPIDGRDVLEFLVRAADARRAGRPPWTSPGRRR